MSASAAVTIEHVVALAGLLNDRIGLKATADGYHALRLALEARIGASGLGADAYVERLRARDGETELKALLPLVTVGKTEFFRDERQFQALRRRVVPEVLQRARAERRKLAIWSAGCATGEEPYSLAMLAVDLGVLEAELELWASDVNPAAVATAREGTYAPRRLRGLSPEHIPRFLEARNGAFHVRPALRRMVNFGVHSLKDDVFPAPTTGAWDLILCRNVFIYFDLTSMVRTLSRMHAALRPGAYLCLGYSESLYRIYDEFELVEVEGSFVYRRPEGGIKRTPRVDTAKAAESLRRAVDEMVRQRRHAAARPTARPPASPPARPPQAALPPTAAARPPGALHGQSELGPGRAPVTPPDAPPGLDRIAHMVAGGEFAAAIRLLEARVARAPEDLAARITLGNLLSLTGRIDDACRTYEAVIGIEPLSAEAHVLLGVAKTESGALAEARRELSRALFLEPALPLAHYYLGRAAELGRDPEAARRGYRNAIESAKSPNARRRFVGYYPDLPEDPDVLARAATYALGLVE